MREHKHAQQTNEQARERGNFIFYVDIKLAEFRPNGWINFTHGHTFSNLMLTPRIESMESRECQNEPNNNNSTTNEKTKKERKCCDYCPVVAADK